MAVEDEMEAATPAAQKPVEREASELDPKTFDLAGWVAGVSAVTHAVTIYQRGDLVGDLDVVKTRLAQAKLSRDKDAVAALEDQAAQIVDALEESSLDVKVQGWSPEKCEAFQKPLKDDGLSDDEVTMRQVAAQVVEPEGFTLDLYRTLLDVLHPQAMMIAGAAVAANLRVPVISVPS